METYAFQLLDNHVIIQMNGHHVLLDTGSPVSFGSVPSIRLAGRDFRLSDDVLGLSVDTISGFLGSRIDVLLGGDILGSFSITLELEPSLVTFAEEGVGVIANSIPMKPVMGVPIVYMGIDGKDVPVFLDTGAKLSYLSSELTADLEKQGDAPDFHPMVGEFTVPVYDVSVSLLGIQSRLRVGNLPPMLECLVSLSGAEGILGNDLLQWGTVCIDYPGCKLGLIPSDSAGQASIEVG